MESAGPKRKHTFRQTPNKRPKQNDGSTALKSGFGAKMLAKMGYTGEGGLGKEGVGISEPIQVVNRGSKGGVGIVSEKSDQQKREERKRTEANGEAYVDSSEEERQERKKKNQAKARSEVSTAQKPKRTIFALEAGGIHVPESMQFVDAVTGASTPVAGVSLRGTNIVSFENSLQARARRDLNAFLEQFEALQLEEKSIQPQHSSYDKELSTLEVEIEKLKDVQTRLKSMRNSTFEMVCVELKDIRKVFPSKALHRESIAIIHPLFSCATTSWDALGDALEDKALSFSEMMDIIQPRSRRMVADTYSQPSDALVTHTITEEEDHVKRGTTSSYETMMLKFWAPKVSSAITQWDTKEPQPMVHLVEIWKPVLPVFMFKRVVAQITQKLLASVHEWNPRRFKKSPHTWIVEWLPYLKQADTDPQGHGLVAEIRRKLRIAFQSLDISRGPLPGLDQWHKVLGKPEADRLITTHLVPRLAAHLRDDFEVNPAEQDMAPLEAVFAWKACLSATVIGELLKAQFFPRFLDVIYQWLSSEEVVFSEVQEWIMWWRTEILKDDINELPPVAAGWNEVYGLINQALDLGDARMIDLPAPQTQAVPSIQLAESSKITNTESPPKAAPAEEITFKEMVEEFCAEENLLLLPLREAHGQTGLPLFRITASATGRGGVMAYLKGDIIWAQNKKDKSLWEPMGLDGALVAKAEAK